MDNYRLLTEEEILALEDNGCTAEDWTSVNVAEDFQPANVRDVRFYGEVFLGVFEKSLEVSHGFFRHSGIRNATLRNAVVGDNCIIENIGNFINNYVIGEECYISNVCIMETTDGATFGEGLTIPVLNEAGSGNVILFSGLTANLAALMVRHSHDKELTYAMRRMAREDIAERVPEVGTIGNRVKIINTSEITNTHIADDCEVNGACRLSDCTLTSEFENSVYIGSGVICENSIIADGTTILNNSNISDCYVGECCQLTNGFTAENSVFFANCYMGNGEACSAFCGPFSASHHKSSLLIGAMFSFYNAGSATNFSNHAYKMGPVHYGVLERGSKTASGSHILLPATIGAFSVCLGKIANHPNTASMPFSYIISDGKDTYLVPAKCLGTVGLFRDVRKWKRRDMRPFNAKKSAINYDWLNPMTMNEVMTGLQSLRQLEALSDQDVSFYTFNNCKISRKSLLRGIENYEMAVEMFLCDVMKGKNLNDITSFIGTENTADGTGEWADLAGLLMPAAEEKRIIDEVKKGETNDIRMLVSRLNTCDSRYTKWLWNFALSLACKHYGKTRLTNEDITNIVTRGNTARRKWINEIKQDAEKEHSMGDVEQDVLDKILTQLQKEADSINEA